GVRPCAQRKWTPPHRVGETGSSSFFQVDRAPDNNGEVAETDSLVQRFEKRLEAREARYCLVGGGPLLQC
ncbi:hypothetical protein F442_22682, partial [Phytophthora nicotianae P10297]